MALEENFLYPLYLLLIGGGITGGLIPWFNRLQESKLKNVEKEKERIQKELEMQRQDSQKEIDRSREDHKHSLKIKSELIEKISQSTSETMLEIIEYQEDKDKVKKEETKPHIKWMISSRKIGPLLNLYFPGSQMNKIWGIIHDVLRDSCLFVEKPGHEMFGITIKTKLEPHVQNDSRFFGWKNPSDFYMLLFNDINWLIYDVLKIIQETNIDHYDNFSKKSYE